MEIGGEPQCKKRERVFMAECSNGVGSQHGSRVGREVWLRLGMRVVRKILPPPPKRTDRSVDGATVERGKAVCLEDR